MSQPDSRTLSSRFISAKGFDPDQLFVIAPGLKTDFVEASPGSGSPDEPQRLLRFFRIPMSPGYILKRSRETLTETEDTAGILAEIIAKGMIIPVDGVDLRMTVDREKWDFYRGIDESSNPSEVQLNITNRCVNRCRMCRKYEWGQIDMPVAKITEIIEELRRAELQLLTLSGGEPFLHRNIEEILDSAGDLSLLIFTSGTVPIPEGRLKKIGRIQFSVDALDPEIYKYIRGPGEIEIIKKNIRKAKDAGCSVTVTTAIQKANILNVPDIMDLCEREGVPFLPAVVHHYDDLAFYDVGCRRLPPVCAVPLHHCLIDPIGDIFVCCHHHEDNTDYKSIDRRFILGNVFKAKFLDIWFSGEARDIRKRLIGTRADFCRGCYRYLLENDAASFIRSSGQQPEGFPLSHTYFFPLKIMAPLRTAE